MIRVAKKRAVQAGGKILPEGTVIEEGSLPADFVARLLEHGFLEQDLDDAVVIEPEEGDEDPIVKQRAAGRVSPTPWDFDPADLEGVPLEQLNVLISERWVDQLVEFEPFDTVEEAVAHLCQDRDLRA